MVYTKKQQSRPEFLVLILKKRPNSTWANKFIINFKIKLFMKPMP